MLYDPAQFDSLVDEPWDEARVRDAIEAIVADVDGAFDPDALWPAHEWDGWQAALPMKNLYVGAAGVVWALDALSRRGPAVSRLDLQSAAVRALELWRAAPDYLDGMQLPSPSDASLLCGEAGILLVVWWLTQARTFADDLHALVLANEANEAEELMWGVPGTLVAARAMRAWTGEERWADAWTRSAEALRSRRDAGGLWTQRLYGDEGRFLGPAHGLVGVVLALLQGDDDRNDRLARETGAVLADVAVVEEGLATWPARVGGPLTGPDGAVRLQWCHGAPGIVCSAASYLDEELLLAGAELVWRAGGHGDEKGAGICHGTAGNGYALLKTFARTRDELWLERARRFAVHALAQVGRLRAERGRGRYSLWTGDLGTALFAAACLEADARYPVLDGP